MYFCRPIYADTVNSGIMLAARACLLRSPLTSQSLAFKVQTPTQGFARLLRTRVRQAEIPVAGKVPTTAPFAVGQSVVAGGAVVGLGSLVYYGLGLSPKAGTLEESFLWPQYVRDRVRDSYMYVAGSLGITAASTVAIYRSPAVFRLFNAQGLMGLILPLVGLIALGSAMRSVPYEPGFGAKHVLWMLHSGMVGGIIAPLMMLGGPILLRAAIMTAGVVGGLSTVAMCAPSDTFMNMGAPLGIAFGVVFASCIGTMFMPPTTLAGASLHSIALYGGVVIFSLLLLYQTQALMNNAKHQPAYVQFDPINASAGIYMSIINLFMRFVMMSGMNKRK